MSAITYNGKFQQVLEGMIDAEIEQIKSDLVASAFAQDEYCARVGKVAGLREALELCGAAKTQLDKQ